jgi:hypothetical protein
VELRVSALWEEGDHQITPEDITTELIAAQATSARIVRLASDADDPATLLSDNRINEALQHAIKEALKTGETRLTLRLDLPPRSSDGIAQDNVRLEIRAASATDHPARPHALRRR